MKPSLPELLFNRQYESQAKSEPRSEVMTRMRAWREGGPLVNKMTNASEGLAQDCRDRRQISRAKPTSGEKRPCCASHQSPTPLVVTRQANRSSWACPVGRVIGSIVQPPVARAGFVALVLSLARFAHRPLLPGRATATPRVGL